MVSTKELLKDFQLSEADKRGKTPEQIAAFEEFLELLKNGEYGTARHPERFDAKDMVPVGHPRGQGVPWKRVDDLEAGAEGSDKPKPG